MARKKAHGYFVRGEFVASGSALDEEFKRELRGDAPSKTELKARSAELQALGVRLAELPAGSLGSLTLPQRLADALEHLRGIRDFEGQRRQRQFVGKLMRQLDADTVDSIRLALEREHAGAAADTARLHQAERWRERLLADDAAATEWAQAFPRSDLARLRTLVRQARKDAAPDAAEPRPPARHGRAYRELFQMVQRALDHSGQSAAG